MSSATVTVEGDRTTVLLPPEVRLAEGLVEVRQVGDTVVLTPKKPGNAWDVLKDVWGKAHDDFLPERVQPPHDARDVSFE